MAYGPGGLGTDGNRGIHASSYAGDDSKQPDAALAVSSLDAPSNNLLGQPSMNGPTAQQAMPDANLHGDGVYDASRQVSGPSELLGQNPSEGIKDDEYPSLGSVPLPGDPDGYAAVDWNSVGPYEYPDFGKQPSPVNGAGADISSPAPLT